MPNPLIVIGCSRSGTSLVARLLKASGVYIGVDTESNGESISIQSINKWIMHNGASTLESPTGMAWLANDRVLFAMVSESTRQLYAQSRYERGRDREACAFKDPRLTFTLPVWLDVFPEARVVHVLRHGLDVVESLMARRRAVERRWLRGDAPAASELLRTNRAVANLMATDRDACFEHWRLYVEAATRAVERLGPERAATVRYEDLVAGRLSPDAAALTGIDLTRCGDVELHQRRAFAHRETYRVAPIPAHYRPALERHAYA